MQFHPPKAPFIAVFNAVNGFHCANQNVLRKIAASQFPLWFFFLIFWADEQRGYFLL